MGSAKDVISWAFTQLGTSDATPYWRHVSGTPWAGEPWCAAFVSAALGANGVFSPYFPSAVAFDERDDLGDRMVPAQQMVYGDAVGFSWRANRHGDHVGLFVERIDSECFKSIEGNTSGGIVAVKTRYYSEVTCGLRPYYDDSPAPHYSDKLDVDGWAGPATISEIQRQLSLGFVDGVLSGQLEAHDKYRPNIWAVEHGAGGSMTVCELQRRLELIYRGLEIDGLWGYETSRVVQRWLSDCGYYNRSAIDGVFGKWSVMSLQTALNDGAIAEKIY